MTPTSKRVVGVDPGSQHLGWGVVDVCGNRFVHVASGVLHAPKVDLVLRLRFLGDSLQTILSTHAPDEAAVEDIFHARNSRSALVLGHARGTVLYCLSRCDIPVFAYTAGQIKQASTGHGAAQKPQVRAMVCMVLGLTAAMGHAHAQTMGLDQSDALAAALCHAQQANRFDLRGVRP